MYILRKMIFESVSQAKKYLNANDISLNDSEYLNLKDLLKKNIGYLGKFTEWLFEEELDIEYLKNLYELIIKIGLDKDINSFNTSEELYDYLQIKKNERKINKVIQELPSGIKKQIDSKFRKMLEDNIDYLDYIYDMYSKVSFRYKNENIDKLYKDTLEAIKRVTGGWTPYSIKYNDEELVYIDNDTLILNIKDYNRSCDLGSKSWCIVTSPYHFREYTDGYAEQYFIYDFTKEPTDAFSLIGLTMDENHVLDNIFDRFNNRIKKDNDVIRGFLPIIKNHYDKYVSHLITYNTEIKKGNYNNVKKMVEEHNIKPSFGDLEKAIESGSLKLVDYIFNLIIDRGVRITFAHRTKIIEKVTKLKKVDIFKYFINNDNIEFSPNDIFNAIYNSLENDLGIDIIKELLEYNKSEDIENNHRLFTQVAEMGDVEIAKLFLNDSRFDPSSNRNSAIRYAAKKGNLEMVKFLNEDERTDLSDLNNFAIKHAIKNGHFDVAMYISDELGYGYTNEDLENYRKKF